MVDPLPTERSATSQKNCSGQMGRHTLRFSKAMEEILASDTARKRSPSSSKRYAGSTTRTQCSSVKCPRNCTRLRMHSVTLWGFASPSTTATKPVAQKTVDSCLPFSYLLNLCACQAPRGVFPFFSAEYRKEKLVTRTWDSSLLGQQEYLELLPALAKRVLEDTTPPELHTAVRGKQKHAFLLCCVRMPRLELVSLQELYTFWIFQKISQKVLRRSPIRMGSQ
jgi:hypothetical protein